MGPNGRALLATGVIALLALWFRSRTDAGKPGGIELRRSFLLLAIAVPVIGLLIPYLPWKVAGALIVVATVTGLALAQRRG